MGSQLDDPASGTEMALSAVSGSDPTPHAAAQTLGLKDPALSRLPPSHITHVHNHSRYSQRVHKPKLRVGLEP